MAVFLTGDRSASAVLALSLVAVACMYACYYPQWRFWIVLWGLLIGILGYIFAMTQRFLSGRIFVLFRELSEFSSTSYGQLFKSSFLMWKENPLLGVGYKKFSDVNQSFYDQGIVTYAGLHAHNYYLGWLSELGLLGFFSFIIFVAFFVWSVSMSRSDIKPLGVGALIIIFWPLTTTMNFFSSATSVVNWYALSLLMALIAVKQGNKNCLDQAN